MQISVQIQKPFVYVFFFPFPLFFFGPSPAGHFLSPFLLLPLAAQPRPSLFPFLSPARAAHSPIQPSFPAHGSPFLPFLFPRARGPSASSTAHRRVRLCPAPSPLSLSLACGSRRSDLPSPRPTGTPLRVRLPRVISARRIRLGPARPGARGHPYLSRRTPRALSPKPQPPRALTLASALFAAAVAARTSGHRRAAAPLPPVVAQPPPKHHVVVRILGRPSFPSSPLLPWMLGAHRSSPPPLAAGRRLRPPPLPLYPLIKFLASPSTSPSRSEPKPTRETHYRVKSGEPPPPPPRRLRPAAASAPSRATSAPPPSDRDPTAPARSKPQSNELDTDQPCRILQNSPYVFPESTRTPSQFKSIHILVLFLLFRPL
jgi:hypothetical protein